jgi:hypothetical protein
MNGEIVSSRPTDRGGHGHAGARLLSTGISFSLKYPQTVSEKVKAMKKTRNDVGYGRPPIEHQFKPGRSGNPFGRPKGARRFTADLLDELGEIVAVTSGDQKRAVTKSSARSSTC